MNRKSIKTFSAKVTIGLEKAYEKEKIEKNRVIEFIQKIQNELIKNNSIYLSVSVSECEIVMSGQIEPHLVLNFINYPKFPLKEDVLKMEIEELTKKLASQFKQNRVVIEYLDETVMFEQNDNIDPRIATYNS